MLKLLSKRKGAKGILVVMQVRKLHPHLRPSLRCQRLEPMLGSPREAILMNPMIQYDDPGDLIVNSNINIYIEVYFCCYLFYLASVGNTF